MISTRPPMAASQRKRTIRISTIRYCKPFLFIMILNKIHFHASDTGTMRYNDRSEVRYWYCTVAARH
jgi:hypothetical protein